MGEPRHAFPHLCLLGTTQDNDKVLKPYIGVLVRGCVRNVSSAPLPYHYLIVLRSLIRAVSRLSMDSTLFEEFTVLIPFVVEVRVVLHPFRLPPPSPLLVFFWALVCCALCCEMPMLAYWFFCCDVLCRASLLFVSCASSFPVRLSQNLVRLYDSLTDPVLKDIALELCLTLPTSLEKRIPFLPMLLKPLILALKPRSERSNDLVAVGYVFVVTIA